ncbi:MAG: response regulator, partial [Muribaculaceae bacterium]|nr:response regulator [Muribaculaceae bacterium]
MAIKKYSFVIPTIILLLTFTMTNRLCIFAQDNKQDNQIQSNSSNISVMTHLTVADGLSSDIVKCIYRDSHNLLWIGTSSGLNRWDGHEVRVYTSQQLPYNLHSGFVSSIQEDAKDNLWIEWDNKNLVYLRELDTFIPLSEYIEGLNPDIHYDTHIDAEKNLWCIDNKGELNMFDPYGHSQGKIKLSRDFGNKLSWSDHPDGGILIFCGNDGVIKIEPDLKSTVLLAKIYGNKKFNDHNKIFTDTSGKLWIYSYHDKELLCFDPMTNEWNSIMLPGSRDTGNSINGIVDNNDGLLLISTDHQGIYILDKQNQSFINHIQQTDGPVEQSLISNRISDLFVDKEGNIWIGYLRHGVSVVHSYSIIQPYSGKYMGDVLALLNEEDGRTWIGTDGNGLFFRDNDGIIKKWDGIPSVAIMSLSKTHEGKILAGSYDHGIYIIDGNTTTHLSLNKGNFPTNSAWLTKVDRNGNIWIGSIVDGLFKMRSDGETRRITYADGSKVTSVCLFDDNSDSLYVSTGNGYARININNDNVSPPVIGNKSGSQQFLNAYISNIFKDSDNIIWLGHCGGLSAYDQRTDSIYYIHLADGLVDNTITDITEDSRRVIWIGTYNGLSAITKHIHDDKSLHLSFANYSVSDGLCSNYISPNSFRKLPNNDILIGGVNGYSRLSPGLIREMPKDRKIIFTSLKIGGKEVSVNSDYDELKIQSAIGSIDRLILNAPVREVTIGFASDDILSNSRLKYAYFIKGLTKDWIVTDKHEITVSQLPAGKYELLIKAMNSNGEWSNSISKIRLDIKHPWYFRWWSIILYILFISAAISFFIYYRIRRIKEKEAIRMMEKTTEHQRNLNEMKLQFFTNVSHDLKTPLTLILSPLQLLMNKNYDDDTNSSLKIINRNATHLLSLIENLLDFRKLDIGGETLHPIKCDVIFALSDVCNDFKTYASMRNVIINVNNNISSLYASTDIVKLKKCLYNILSNALKFSPENSTISIDFIYSGKTFVIKVSDQGSGIPDNIKHAIFSRFFQGVHSESNPGSGIGLHIVSEYIKMMNGKVEVFDNQPVGSCFVISIPIEDKGNEMNIPSSNIIPKDQSTCFAENPDSVKNQLTILVVDDNKDLCKFLSDTLKTEGYEVVMANNAAEALRQLEVYNVGIVVSDVMMPGIDGIELCRRIKRDLRYSHIPVILLTAKNSDETRLKGLENGADDYLTKPFNYEILRLRIQKFIELRNEKTKRFRNDNELLPTDISITPLDEQFMKKSIKIVEE